MADLKKYPENVDKIQDFVTRPKISISDWISGSSYLVGEYVRNNKIIFRVIADIENSLIQPSNDITKFIKILNQELMLLQKGIVDTDGQGHLSISPLAFPNVNYSGNTNPTKINPEFKLTFKDPKTYDDYSEEGEIISPNVHPYEWDGTENDNKLPITPYLNSSSEPILDENSEEITHLRKNYSDKEVANYIKTNLGNSINFAKVDGPLHKWLIGTNPINIGGGANGSEIFIDPVGVNPEKNEVRTEGLIDVSDSTEVGEERARLTRLKQYARWLLTNTHYYSMRGLNKSPFVKDYPFVYNSEHTESASLGDASSKDGAYLPVNIKAYDIRMYLDGTVTTLRPFTPDMAYYHKENSYHNNITLDMGNPSTYGRHNISILHDFSVPNTGINGTILASLNTLYNSVSVPGTDPHIVRKVVTGTKTVFYYKRREKLSVSAFVEYPIAPTSTQLQYTENATYDITVHLNPSGPGSAVDVRFVHVDTALDMLQILSDHNDLIPQLIRSTDDTHLLESIFADTSVINSTTDLYGVYGHDKTRSKKTFIHLPADGIVDGTPCELDISLPKDPVTSAFNQNSVGILSGYKNYITQPRVYILSGYKDETALDVGLTERNNPYLFSAIPEVEYAEDGNVFHQRNMSLDDINGNKFIRKISFSEFEYVDAITSDKGKVIVGETSGDTAVLLNYNNITRIWIIRLLTGAEFEDNESCSIINGTGSGNTTGIISTPSEDKRVLIATVYPTSTNTFGWRMDNDPSLRLLHWSLWANSEYSGSASYVAYKRNKQVYDDFVNDGHATFNMDVSASPLSYNNDFIASGIFCHIITAHTRVFLPEHIIPVSELDIVTGNNLELASVTKQSRKAFNSLISDFYKGRVKLNTRADMDTINNQDIHIAITSTMTTIPSNWNDFMDITLDELPSNGNENYLRWLTKANYLPKYIVDANLDTNELTSDPFQDASDFLRDFLDNYFISNKDTETDAEVGYIPGTIRPTTNPTFEFGNGGGSVLVDYLNSEGYDEEIVTDLKRRLWESSFDILYENRNRLRKCDGYEFTAEVMNYIDTDDEYFSRFYGFHWGTFARIMSMDGVIPIEYNMETVSFLDTIENLYPMVKNTFINAIRSNPAIQKSYITGDISLYSTRKLLNSNIVSAFEPDSDFDAFESNANRDVFLSNFVSGSSNKLSNRFYNSFRLLLTGGTNSEMDADPTTTRIFEANVVNYFNNYVSNADLNISVQTDYARYKDNAITTVTAEDLNVNWHSLDDGTKILPVFTISSATSSTITLNHPLASSVNNYYTGSVVKIVTGTGINERKVISTYDGTTKVATLASNWTATPDGTSSAVVITNIKNLIQVSGPQFLFKQSFFASKMVRTYIRVKIKLIYSEKMGRWVTLDYRQYPTTYLTPTFGSTALAAKEKSIIYPGSNGKKVSDYIPFKQADYDNAEQAIVKKSNRKILTYDTDYLAPVNFSTGTDVVVYLKKYNGLLKSSQDQANHIFTGIESRKLTHFINVSAWDKTVTYNSGDKVSSMGHVFQATGSSVGYPEPYYNTNFILKMPKLFSAPHWNSSVTYAEGDFVTYNNIVYRVLKETTSIIEPYRNDNYIAYFNLVISADYWNVTVNYSIGDLVLFNGINYRANSAVYGGSSPNLNSSFDVYKRFNPYILNWEITKNYAVNDIVCYNNVFYKVNTATIGGNPPNSNSKFTEIVEFFEPNSTEKDEYVIILVNEVPENLKNNVYISTFTNTINNETYPYNTFTEGSYTDYIWKHSSGCVQDPYKVPYYKMNSMEINRFCLPFLYNVFPYDTAGNIKGYFRPDQDPIPDDIRPYFAKLLSPHAIQNDTDTSGIGFVIPNNVHGGKQDSIPSFFLFQPHLFKVYWHMRPATSSYYGTDVPSPTGRTGGKLADPTLSNMFDFPNLIDNTEFRIPWHVDMSANWLYNGETVERIIEEVDDTEVILDENDAENDITDEN